MYSIEDSCAAFQWRSAFVRRYLNKADERWWCTDRIINPLHILVDIFHDVLSQGVVDIAEVWKGFDMVLLGVVYRKSVCWPKHENTFWCQKANLVLQNVYNILLIVDCKSDERHDVSLQCALLKSIFNNILFPLRCIITLQLFACLQVLLKRLMSK